MDSITFNNQNIFFIFDENNEPWFKAKDVTEILEYGNPRQAVIHNVDKDDRNMLKNLQMQGSLSSRLPLNMQPHTVFINEPGLYALIFGSKLPAAKAFKRWVYEEVLPSIRKTGEYKVEQKFRNQLENLNRQILEKENTINQLNHKIKPDVVPKTVNPKLRHKFILLKLYDPEVFTYYVIRCQQRNIKKKLQKINERYPNNEKLIDIEYPNSINLYNRIKEQLKDKLDYYSNYFQIQDKNYTEEELIARIRDQIRLIDPAVE